MYDLSALPVVALLGALPWVVLRFVMRVPLRRLMIEALFVAYAAALLYVVVYPQLPVSVGYAGYLSSFINLVPFATVLEISRNFHGQVIRQLVGNMVMFAPLGFLLPLMSLRCRRFFVTLGVALAISVGIELIQLAMLLTLVSRRSADIDDVILNVAGAALGYFVWRIAHAVIRDASVGDTVQEHA
jgi:glycopeptide antibiotics resistance protein